MMTEYKKEPNHVPCLLRKINLFEQPTEIRMYKLSPSITHPRLAAYYDRPTNQATDNRNHHPLVQWNSNCLLATKG